MCRHAEKIKLRQPQKGKKAHFNFPQNQKMKRKGTQSACRFPISDAVTEEEFKSPLHRNVWRPLAFCNRADVIFVTGLPHSTYVHGDVIFLWRIPLTCKTAPHSLRFHCI